MISLKWMINDKWMMKRWWMLCNTDWLHFAIIRKHWVENDECDCYELMKFDWQWWMTCNVCFDCDIGWYCLDDD